jgi:hypothetical protein
MNIEICVGTDIWDNGGGVSFLSSLLSLFVQTKCSCPWDTSITVNVIDIVRYMNEIQKIIKKFWRSNSIWV